MNEAMKKAVETQWRDEMSFAELLMQKAGEMIAGPWSGGRSGFPFFPYNSPGIMFPRTTGPGIINLADDLSDAASAGPAGGGCSQGGGIVYQAFPAEYHHLIRLITERNELSDVVETLDAINLPIPQQATDELARLDREIAAARRQLLETKLAAAEKEKRELQSREEKAKAAAEEAEKLRELLGDD